ncbi:MAG: type I-E CRISPR-associated protein Cas7/Cse4/CasC [Candidatus Omnitrophica bacterium]|nr:type I-E CRISPR-associated protein Cas7/Cse4/CasC [Candidatus Omnitrophota bacterium]MBU4479217.1 type I-E CRISPR-associated protein Cas7/Cse4/CasC [Candidatus Omnitrophota bacterium]
MDKFIQLHILTNYGPSNLNRDDLGRPKTVVIGGVQRLRVSSQCLKRAWRTAEVFEAALAGHIGTRTKEMGKKIHKDIISGGIKEKEAKEWAAKIAEVFGKRKDEDKKDPLSDLEIRQLAHFSTEEIIAIDSLVKSMIGRKSGPSDEELKLLRKNHGAADIAMFGRMLADNPAFNAEAAVQVAHAFTVHKVAVEDDYFSAVDDLNKHEEHSGSGHIGEAEFGAGLFYLYVCIDRALLKENLGNNEELAKKAISVLVESAVTVSPIGKQNSFASRAYASYVLAEKGDKQPRSLACAFLKPVNGDDVADSAVDIIKKTRETFNKVYGDETEPYELNAVKGEGALEGLKKYCVEK